MCSSVYIEKLSRPDEADAVEVAVQQALVDHEIESWMYVGAFHNPPRVKVCSEHGPIIIRGFGEWRPVFERDFTAAVRRIAPAADIDLEWGYPDER